MAVDVRVCARRGAARDELAFAVVLGERPSRDELDAVCARCREQDPRPTCRGCDGPMTGSRANAAAWCARCRPRRATGGP